MIARHLVTVCLIYASMVLQSSVSNDVAFGSFRPWLPGVALVACVVMHNRVAGLVWASLLGLGVDSVSADRLGVHVVLVTLVAIGLSMMQQEGRSHGAVYTGVLVLAATSLWRSLSAAIQGILADQRFDFPRVLISAFGDGVYTAVLTIVVLLFVRLLTNAIRPQKSSSTIPLTNRWSMLT